MPATPVTPATNRQIAPANSSLTMGDYLKGQHPALDKIRTGLALFAVFTIVRFLLQRFHRLVRRERLLPQSERRDVPRVPARLQDERHPTWHFDEKPAAVDLFTNMKHKDTTTAKGRLTIDPKWSSGTQALPRQLISRLPPAPPLTPPELSSAVFNFSPDQVHAVDSFMHQPNPDYMGSTASVMSQPDSTSAPTPRRRSYQKILPIGIPTPQQSFKADVDSANAPFSPSSYPPTSPLLPPPPPGNSAAFGHGQVQRDVNLQGEIISVLDNDGAGWSRHTRVYGGGVCLACAASGGEHGGFYGATVTPEEMRQDAYMRRSGSLVLQS